MHRNNDYLPEFEPPKKTIVTDYEEQVKTLYHKQQTIAINLKTELENEKIFEKGLSSTLISHYTAGTSTLEQLKEEEQRISKINDLRQIGLTQSDMHLYFDYINNGIKYVQNKYSNHEPELLTKKIDNILQLVQSKSINSNEFNITKIPDPMDYIKDISSKLHNVSDTSKPLNIKKIRRKARKLQNKLQQEPSENLNKSISYEGAATSFWDSTEAPELIYAPELQCNQSNKLTQVNKTHLYTIRDGVIVSVNESEKKLKETKFLVTGQLTIEEIVKLQKFSNYKAGEPSNVLYIKNLPKQISVEDLKTIFKVHPALEYNPLRGKMHGQAFIKYESVEVASEVLHSSNGLIVNNKPVIVQFAKSTKR